MMLPGGSKEEEIFIFGLQRLVKRKLKKQLFRSEKLVNTKK